MRADEKRASGDGARRGQADRHRIGIHKRRGQRCIACETKDADADADADADSDSDSDADVTKLH